MWRIANNERTGILFPVRHAEKQNMQTITLSGRPRWTRTGLGFPACRPGRIWRTVGPRGGGRRPGEGLGSAAELPSLERMFARVLPCHRANVRTAAKSAVGDGRTMMRRWWLIGAACALTVGGAPAIAGSQALAARAPSLAGATQTGSSVLLVCNGSTKPCPPGTSVFSTVQSAVNAAKSGDWILIWPGVYHEKSTQWPTAGVWIQKPNLHIRGLDRNQVIIDGSNGTASQPCPSSPSLQDTNGGAGRDGIVVAKASGVTIQNLTVCDYLAGTGGHGNEIWWNGGDGTGKIGMSTYTGSYLSATSMYGPSDLQSPNLAQYGIFVSNARGPGVIEESYASNMADAAYYVGACQQVCHATLKHDVGTNSNLGYSGTNAGGPLVIKDSVFSRNRAGIVPNSLNNEDAPPPQNGACPGTAKSCFFLVHNVIKNNNNPNAPTSGLAGAIGTGVEISGGAYDTVVD